MCSEQDIKTEKNRRTARYLGRTIVFGLARGAAAAVSSATVTGLLWWLQNR